MVRAGVIASPNVSNKASDHPPDRQVDKWLFPEMFKKGDNFVYLHLTWAKFCCFLFLCPVLICSSSRVAHRKGT